MTTTSPSTDAVEQLRRRPTLRITLGIVGILLASALGTAVSAYGETITVTDPAGDTTPANDVTKLRISYDGPKVVAVATYRSLGTRHLGSSLQLDPGTRGGTKYDLMRYQDFDGRWKTAVYAHKGPRSAYRRVACPGKRVIIDRVAHTLRFRVPVGCISRAEAPDQVRVQVIGGIQEGGGVPQELAPNKPVLLHHN